MKNTLIILFALVLFSCTAFSQESKDSTKSASEEKTSAKQDENTSSVSQFSFNPSLGLTYLNSSKAQESNENLQWLAKLQTKYSYEGKSFQLNTSLLSQYGQIHSKHLPAEKFQDDFIFTLTPSMTVINKPAIRLFLETVAETQMGKGKIGERPTSFADPLFLYQTLFVGQKQFLIQSTDKSNFEVTYGIGYAFQQTLTRSFKKDTLSTSAQTNFESGVSAIFQIDMNVELAKNLKYKLSLKSVALSKDDFFKDVKSSRGSVLLGTGIFYSLIGIEYNLHMVYDKNYSPVRQLEQSLLVTFNLDL